MRKPKRAYSPAVTMALFVTAVAMLLGSTISGTRAALTYYSDTYSSRLQMYDIGVTLMENGEAVSWRDYNSAGDGTWNENTGTLLEHMLPEGEELKPGKVYPEELKVVNTGTINQYVRVSICKYWLDAEGNKDSELSPELIGLETVNLGSDWIEDEEARTPERTVLYYNKLLHAQGEGRSETVPFAESLVINDSIAAKVTEKTEKNGSYTTITTTFDYDGAAFRIEVQVDAVQEHNAEDAALSAWGRRVRVHDGSLSLSN